jgi:hypothetical protein
MQDSIFGNWKGRQMKKTLIAALGLVAALAFTAPAFEASSALAATTAAATTKPMKKTVHHAACKPTKTHKCPVHHTMKKKKPTT